MTIAKRLSLLLALPIVALLVLSGFVFYQLKAILKESRFVSEKQIGSLAMLGNISRHLADARVNLRNCILVDQSIDESAATAFHAHTAEIPKLLARYGDALISDDADRRIYAEFRELSHDWT